MGLNLAFSGAGFLAIYHVGAVSCLKFYGKKLVDSIENYGGASAGAITACMVLCDIDLEESVQFVMHTASKVNSYLLGPLSTSFDPSSVIRKVLRKNLPENAYKLASGRLHISLTRVSDWKNEIVSEFGSNKELIDALVCTSYIPFFSGVLPPKFKGVHYIDGGFTDNLPQHFDGDTITVSPFSGESDICPDDGHKTTAQFDLKNTSVQMTSHNMYRMARALFPPDNSVLEQMCRQGFRDTLKYLHDHYPDKLNIGVDIVSIPRCCDLAYPDYASEDDCKSTCSCGSTAKDSFFSDMEKFIAKTTVMDSIVFPEQMNKILKKTTNILQESNVYGYIVNAFLNVSKWMVKPHFYAYKHLDLFIQGMFRWLLPKLKELSSYNFYTRSALNFAVEVYHAYNGTSTYEWHPSLNEKKCTDIQQRRQRICYATKSIVAIPKLEKQLPLESRLGHEAPPPSRVSSFVSANLIGGVEFNVFESEYSTENENDDVDTDYEETPYKRRRTNIILSESKELLLKDEDGLIMKFDKCAPHVPQNKSTSEEHTDDYGHDLDYLQFSDESFVDISESEIQDKLEYDNDGFLCL